MEDLLSIERVKQLKIQRLIPAFAEQNVVS